MAECIFCKIAGGELPAEIIHQDDRALAFRDLNPQAPHHVLVIPRLHLSGLSATTDEQAGLLGHLLLVASRVAGELGLETGYRVVVNDGAEAGQTVFHLHVHLLGGRGFGWPPG